MVRALSKRGILFGTVESAGLPALYAAASPEAQGGRLYGPSGLGHLGGAPAEQPPYSRVSNAEEASRIWRVSEQLTQLSFTE